MKPDLGTACELIRRMNNKIGEDSLGDEEFYDLYNEAVKFLKKAGYPYERSTAQDD